jgi:hypothetical protein
MFVRSIFCGVFAITLLIGCSSGSHAEKDGSKMSQQSDKQVKSEDKQSKPEIASCTGGEVPAGADKCLLDLGTGKDTYWSDSDGVDPATAGCHYEFKSNKCEKQLSERTFGELCLDDDRLVESNPGKDECHKHGVDLGKPDVVSCSEWCQSEGNSSGHCKDGIKAKGEYGPCQSARCVCE